VRGTVDLRPSTGPRGYAAAVVRGDWLQPIGDDTALVAGAGLGGLTYGFVFDSPTAYTSVLAPAVGILFGNNRSFGRIVTAVTGFVPLGSLAHPRDSAGQAISPPHVMATLLLSL